MATAVYPPIDADHIVQWDLDEQVEDLLALDVGLGTLDGAHTPPQWALYKPFVDSVGGLYPLQLYDTFPQSSNSRFFEIGAPGPFGGSVVFKGGSGSIERDYLMGDVVPEPEEPITIDMWLKPFALTSNANLIQKEYSPSAWGEPPTAVQMYQITATGEWGVSITTGGTRHFIDQIGHGNSVQHLRLVYGVWNHIGLTYDGSALRAYINGLFAGQASVEGAISYGSHGYWVLGGSRAIGAAANDAANACIGRTRISKV